MSAVDITDRIACMFPNLEKELVRDVCTSLQHDEQTCIDMLLEVSQQQGSSPAHAAQAQAPHVPGSGATLNYRERLLQSNQQQQLLEQQQQQQAAQQQQLLQQQQQQAAQQQLLQQQEAQLRERAKRLQSDGLARNQQSRHDDAYFVANNAPAAAAAASSSSASAPPALQPQRPYAAPPSLPAPATHHRSSLVAEMCDRPLACRDTSSQDPPNVLTCLINLSTRKNKVARVTEDPPCNLGSFTVDAAGQSVLWTDKDGYTRTLRYDAATKSLSEERGDLVLSVLPPAAIPASSFDNMPSWQPCFVAMKQREARARSPPPPSQPAAAAAEPSAPAVPCRPLEPQAAAASPHVRRSEEAGTAEAEAEAAGVRRTPSEGRDGGGGGLFGWLWGGEKRDRRKERKEAKRRSASEKSNEVPASGSSTPPAPAQVPVATATAPAATATAGRGGDVSSSSIAHLAAANQQQHHKQQQQQQQAAVEKPAAAPTPSPTPSASSSSPQASGAPSPSAAELEREQEKRRQEEEYMQLFGGSSGGASPTTGVRRDADPAFDNILNTFLPGASAETKQVVKTSELMIKPTSQPAFAGQADAAQDGEFASVFDHFLRKVDSGDAAPTPTPTPAAAGAAEGFASSTEHVPTADDFASPSPKAAAAFPEAAVAAPPKVATPPPVSQAPAKPAGPSNFDDMLKSFMN